jgi:glycosyltransferase involved in cell wall biosynthesis
LYFKQHPVDIIHSHAEFTDILALGLKISARVPMILRTVHVAYPNEWMGKPLRRFLFTDFLHPIYYDYEIGINLQNTTRLNNRPVARLLNRRSLRIYNAVDLQRFETNGLDTGEIRKKLDIPEGAFVIGSIGRLDHQKGFTYLIEAAATILKNHPNTVFIIIGDGPLANDLKLQAFKLGISDKVIFTGPRADIHELLSIMDVFVSSSLWEGFPTVLLESMACHIPILATDNPGTRELVQHGVTGWLVEPQSSLALSDGLEVMINSTNFRVKLSTQAREEVNQFSISNIAKQYEYLYSQMNPNNS